MHALVADDDFNTCASVSKMLTSIGLRAEWTTSGNEAILRTTFAKENHDEFQVYIIDWLMSDMNGIEVVRRIRKVIGEDKPIIILTAYDWSDIEAEKRSGRYRILRKAPVPVRIAGYPFGFGRIFDCRRGFFRRQSGIFCRKACSFSRGCGTEQGGCLRTISFLHKNKIVLRILGEPTHFLDIL